MNGILRAAIVSTLVVGAAWVLYLLAPEPVGVLLYIFVMLPVAAIDDSGALDVGSYVNGFFFPTPMGYAIASVAYWLALLLLLSLTWKTSRQPKQVRERHW